MKNCRLCGTDCSFNAIKCCDKHTPEHIPDYVLCENCAKQLHKRMPKDTETYSEKSWKTDTMCANCGKPIGQWDNGDWYHLKMGLVECKFNDFSNKAVYSSVG